MLQYFLPRPRPAGAALLFASTALHAVLLAATPPARAQTAPSSQSQLKTPPEKITVTARRRSYVAKSTAIGTKTDTPIIETPLNVQVVTQQTLLDQQVTSIDQALTNVSGITVGFGGAADNGQRYSSITVRGFTTDTHFRDGVRLDSNGGDSGTFDTDFANIDTIEVLKGPAAILYGAVEPGGIVNITTKQPQATPSYAIEQQFGSEDFFRTSVDATGPVPGTNGALLYRIDADVQNEHPDVDATHDKRRLAAPVLTWHIDADTDLTLEAQYKFADFSQTYGNIPFLGDAPLNPSRSVNYGEGSPDREATVLAGARLTHHFNEDWQIRSQFLFNQVIARGAGVLPFALVMDPVFPSGLAVARVINAVYNRDTTYSINVDLVGHFRLLGLDQTFLAGGDLQRLDNISEISQSGQLNDFTGPPSTLTGVSFIDAVNPVHPGTPFNQPLSPYIADTTTTDTGGFYMQDQVKLPWYFQLLAGLRVQYLRQVSNFGFDETLGQPLAPNPSVYDDAVTKRAALLWHPAGWFTTYAAYSENFGPNPSGIQPTGQPVPPTAAHSWEAGFKFEFYGGKLRSTVDYYDLTKTNVPSAYPGNPDFELVTGAERSHGVELDLQGEILPHWNVIANYAYTDARVARPAVISGVAEPIGTPLGEVPYNLGHLWTSYEFLRAEDRTFRFGGGATFNGSAPYLYDGPTPRLIPGYATFDLFAAYECRLLGTHVTAQLNVFNLFDRKYFTDIQNAGFPAVAPYALNTALYGLPRDVRFALKAEF
jgi:iron complex outermembrane receptor protein